MIDCEYCGRPRNFTCNNTRDMEDFAEDGDRECFFQLARLGGGEKGLKYVIMNIVKIERTSLKESIQTDIFKESKPDPAYQGGYSDGYDAGEQSCWNDAIETTAELARERVDDHDIAAEILDAILKLKKL